jgi:hypothetical protein
VHRNSVLIKIQPDATVCRYLFIAKSLYMCRVSQHPSSGLLKTVTAASGTGHNIGTATSLHRGLIRPRWIEVASACNTDTTQTQPHQISNTQRTENKTTDVVIQQHSHKLLMMDILMPETCWVHKTWNKITSDIKRVFYSSTITMMHGPVNIRFRGRNILPATCASRSEDAQECVMKTALP